MTEKVNLTRSRLYVVEDKFFTPYIGNPCHVNVLWTLGKSLLKLERANIYTKRKLKPIVQKSWQYYLTK